MWVFNKICEEMSKWKIQKKDNILNFQLVQPNQISIITNVPYVFVKNYFTDILDIWFGYTIKF